jgi:DNA-binding response OmpR family regulator
MAINVLVVDDSAPLRDWLVRVLEHAGYAVTQAGGGEEALALLQHAGEQRAPFDVVISDIVMGGVDGVRVTQVARDHVEPPEVILLTGYGNLDTASRAVRLGAFDYIEKPVSPQLLVERVALAASRREERLKQAEEAAAWRAIVEAVGKVQQSGAPPEAAPAARPQRYRAVGQLQLDTQRHEVSFDGQPVTVTPIEYTILSILTETPGVVVTYGALVRHTHGISMSEREAYGLLRTHVRNLRHKIERDYLISVRSVGYMLDAPNPVEADDQPAPLVKALG